MWMVVLFSGESTHFGSCNAELSHFDKSFKQLSLAKVPFLFIYNNIKPILFQTIQFSFILLFSSIWLKDRTLSGATTPGQSRHESDGNEGVLLITQSSSITGTSPSDCLMWYSEHTLRECYTSADGFFLCNGISTFLGYLMSKPFS